MPKTAKEKLAERNKTKKPQDAAVNVFEKEDQKELQDISQEMRKASLNEEEQAMFNYVEEAKGIITAYIDYKLKLDGLLDRKNFTIQQKDLLDKEFDLKEIDVFLKDIQSKHATTSDALYKNVLDILFDLCKDRPYLEEEEEEEEEGEEGEN